MEMGRANQTGGRGYRMKTRLILTVTLYNRLLVINCISIHKHSQHKEEYLMCKMCIFTTVCCSVCAPISILYQTEKITVDFSFKKVKVLYWWSENTCVLVYVKKMKEEINQVIPSPFSPDTSAAFSLCAVGCLLVCVYVCVRITCLLCTIPE